MDTRPFHDFFVGAGSKVDVDEEFQERYGVDFIVLRLPGIHAAVSMGLHVSDESDDFRQQEVMLEGVRRGVVQKALYIEVISPVLDTGVLPVVYSGAVAFLFDRRLQGNRAIGLRVFEDLSFHYFDIEENVRRLRKDQHDALHHDAEVLSGTIIAYFADKGFGFIERAPQEKFFFHIASVSDEKLKAILPSYTQGDTITVTFIYGGSEGKKYPKAIEVAAAHTD